MKKLFYIKIAFFITLFLGVQISYGQNFADKSYYLVDSLDLNTVGEEDKLLLDSCLKIYHSNIYDTLRIDALSQVCENMMHYRWVDYNEYLGEELQNLLSNSNLNKIEKKIYNILLSGVLNNKGVNAINLGDLANATTFFESSLDINRKYNRKEGEAYALLNLGYIYENQGLMTRGLDNYLYSLKVLEELNDTMGIIACSNNAGYICDIQKEYEMALRYYNKALLLSQKIKYTKGESNCLNNIGSVYESQGNLEKGIKFCEDALKIRRQFNDEEGIAQSLANIASQYEKLYLSQEKRNDTLLNIALKYYNESLQIRERINDVKNISNSLNGLASINLKLGNLDIAQEYAIKSRKIAIELNHKPTERDATLSLYKIGKKKGNFEESLEFFEKYISLDKSIINEENRKKAIHKDANYEYEKKKALDDKENEKRLAIEKEKQQKQFIVLIITISGSSIIVILLLVIYRRLQLTKRQKIIIEEQKEEVESQRDQIEEQKNVVEEAHKEIKDSINYAKRIQEAILPSSSAIKEVLPESFVLYQPKDVVAGDFYWQEKVGDKVYIAAADCTGHGVPGAMVSVVCSNALTKAILEDSITDVCKILDRTREIVIDKLAKSSDVKDGMDISLACFDFDNMKLEWAGANNPLYLLRENEIQVTKGDREPIGYTENPTPFTKHTIDLQKGDTIYLFTDGYADQFGGQEGKKLGYKNFREKLIEISNLEMDKQIIELETYFHEWKKTEEQVDDVCVIGINI